MLISLKHLPNEIDRGTAHERSGSDLMDSFYPQRMGDRLMTLLQDRPVVSLDEPCNNSCSIPYWSAYECEQSRLYLTEKPQINVKQVPIKKVERSGKSSRTQAIARITRILSTDRAMTRTAPA